MITSLRLLFTLIMIVFLQSPSARAADAVAPACNEALGGITPFPTVSTDDIDFYENQRTKLLNYELNSTRDQALTRLLQEEGFDQKQIQERIFAFQEARPGSLHRVLGERTLEEIRTRYIGESIEKIAPESLVGKYLAETGARSKIIRVPLVQGGEVLGPAKLLVAVGPESFAQLQALLNSENYVTVMGHANVLHRNKFWSCGGGATRELNLPNLGTPLPLLLLSTTESARLHRYLIGTSSAFGWVNPLKQPWQLPGYCAKGGYSCCTHWIGNIPIGDKLVDEYKFPGYDRPADEAKIQALAPYEGGTPELRKIWKVPGHEQLASAIGLEENNLVGEFASPGWVIQTLMAAASAERVPVILVSTADHRAELPDIANFVFERPH